MQGKSCLSKVSHAQRVAYEHAHEQNILWLSTGVKPPQQLEAIRNKLRLVTEVVVSPRVISDVNLHGVPVEASHPLAWRPT